MASANSMRIFAVANQKGGVGKTTTTTSLGAALAEKGLRVLVVDLDPQGNATTGLGVDVRKFERSMYDVLINDVPVIDVVEPTGYNNLFVAPAILDLAGVEQEMSSIISREMRLKRALESVEGEFDVVFIDCPPSLGLITINAFAAATDIIVPVQAEFYALEGLTQLRKIVTLVQSNLNPSLKISKVILTMYDRRVALAQDVATEVRNHFPSELCATFVPRSVRLAEAPSYGQPITVYDPSSPGAKAYRKLSEEIMNG
jgi:chromosome partitioning protein